MTYHREGNIPWSIYSYLVLMRITFTQVSILTRFLAFLVSVCSLISSNFLTLMSIRPSNISAAKCDHPFRDDSIDDEEDGEVETEMGGGVESGIHAIVLENYDR